MKVFFYILFCFTLMGLSACSASQEEVKNSGDQTEMLTESIPETVDFNFHVKPILSDRCFKCHGPDPNTREGDFAFHNEEMAFRAIGENKDHYAIIPGDPGNSTLVQRIFSTDEAEVMPPPESNLTLSNFEKEILKKWIAQGAKWKKHWAFLPPQKSALPTIQLQNWPNNEIDYYVLAKMEEKGFNPSEPATKEKLIRRLSFDLTGLPPSLEAIDAFVSNNSPTAYKNLVDSLLNTAAYAERMAADWMDLARYADSHGYQDDLERTMWPWRDWVLHAFQENMPYDQFVTWQLAGDLLPDASLEQIIATGFNRNHKITAEGGVIPEEYRAEYVSDRTQTFATAFLGITMECAKCHDHKYDPLTQKNYFQLYSFFNNVSEYGMIKEYGDTPGPFITLTDEEIKAQLDFINDTDTLAEIELMVMDDRKEPRKTFVLNRGLYDHPGEEVRPATPEAVLPFNENISTDRYGLSRWLFSKDNPLTARVAVNRLWQQLFGTGIVGSSFDFGNQGTLPSHPELLDYLAITFREKNWDVKALLKMIVLSKTYQQAAVVTEEMLELDPENRWLSRASRLRLSAEMVRDQALEISGLLHHEIGGPSVKPWQPEGLWSGVTGGGGGSLAKYVPDEGNKAHRRTLYTFWKRTVPPPNLMIMDASTRDLCTVKRQQTNTPLQALVLLNDPQLLEAARNMALRAVQQKDSSTKEKITTLFRKTTARSPNESEYNKLHTYYETELQIFKDDTAKAKKYLTISADDKVDETNLAEWAALSMLSNLMLNLDESISRG
ncbi:MAG: PSD1 and planctomycete cytochrome C domain-containing protein [Saprospiraceae bacterium]